MKQKSKPAHKFAVCVNNADYPVNFKKPSSATDSDTTDDDLISRYEDGEIVDLTILHASKR